MLEENKRPDNAVNFSRFNLSSRIPAIYRRICLPLSPSENQG